MSVPIRVAIDGNEANVSSRVGSNVFAHELLSTIEQQTRGKTEYSFTIFLTCHPGSDLPVERPGWKYRVLLPQLLWTQWALPRYLFAHRESFDVFFTPGHYAPRNCPVPYICSVMDLAFLSHPSYFTLKDRLQLTYWTRYSVTRADKILTISEASKRDIIEKYHRKAKDVVVGYPAIAAPAKVSEASVNSVLKKFALSRHFIVSIGTLQPRKNLIRLIEAFEVVARKEAAEPLKPSRIRKPKEPVKLVLAGKQGWLAEPIINRWQQSPFKDRIIVTGFVTDREKWALLQQSAVSATVGLAEGFGIPALEALGAGSIPVVSNTTSLPEVVGTAGITVDPTNSLKIADGLWRALTLTARDRALYKKRGREQCKRFSWKKTAQLVLDALAESVHE